MLLCLGGLGSFSSAGSSCWGDLVVEELGPLEGAGEGVEDLFGVGVIGAEEGATAAGLALDARKASNLCFAAFPQSSHRDLTPSDYSLLK